MVWLAPLISSIQVAFYDVIGRFVPGVCLLAGAFLSGVLRKPNLDNLTLVILVATAYVLGHSIQGIANQLILRYRWCRRKGTTASISPSYKARFSGSQLFLELDGLDCQRFEGRAHSSPRSSDRWFSLDDRKVQDFVASQALIYAPEVRLLYDRFLALAEMARGMAVVTLLVLPMPFLEQGFQSTKTAIMWIVGCSLALLGFVDRYSRLANIPNVLALSAAFAKRNGTSA